MTIAQVTIDYVNQPNKNPKYGSIKTKELGYVSVPDESLSQFHQGETCQINYSTNPKGYHNLNQKVPLITPTMPSMQNPPQMAATPIEKDRRILESVLAKLVGPVQFTDRMTMANQMTEIWLAAQDAADRIS